MKGNADNQNLLIAVTHWVERTDFDQVSSLVLFNRNMPKSTAGFSHAPLETAFTPQQIHRPRWNHYGILKFTASLSNPLPTGCWLGEGGGDILKKHWSCTVKQFNEFKLLEKVLDTLSLKNKLEVVFHACGTPTWPDICHYQKLAQTVWELWPAQDFGFRGDKVITKKVRFVSCTLHANGSYLCHHQIIACTRFWFQGR